MKRSTFLKSLLTIPVAVKAWANVEDKPAPIDPRILKNHDPSKCLIKWKQEDELCPQELLGQHVIIDKKRHYLAYLNKISNFEYDVIPYFSQNFGPKEYFEVWKKNNPIELIYDGLQMECYVTNMKFSPAIQWTLMVTGEIVTYESVQTNIPIKNSDQMIADMFEIDSHLLGRLERSTFGQDIYSNIKI